MSYYVIATSHPVGMAEPRSVVLARSRHESGGWALYDEHVRSHREHLAKHGRPGETVVIEEVEDQAALHAVNVSILDTDGLPFHSTRMELRHVSRNVSGNGFVEDPLDRCPLDGKAHWECPKCDVWNRLKNERCYSCGAARRP